MLRFQACFLLAPFLPGSPCVDAPLLDITRPSNGTLLLTLPAMVQRQHYRVRVDGDANVRKRRPPPSVSHRGGVQ